jgi:Uma2 family endonuclease
MARADVAVAPHVTEVPPAPPSRRMSYEEFLEWCDEDTFAEWVDGEVIVLMSGSRPHQLIVKFLLYVLETFCRVTGAGEVLTAPFQVKLWPGGPGREPDVLVVTAEHRDRLLRTRVDGPADVAVEVVSPESVERDRVDKFCEYARAGVREYWLLDPDERVADFYQLGADGEYARVPVDDGVFRSEVLPGFWLRVDWLWRDPPPTIEAVQALGLLAPLPQPGAGDSR